MPFRRCKELYPDQKSRPEPDLPEWGIAFLQAMDTAAVTLANNHIGDYGDAALENTLRLLEESGIRHAGAGADISAAYAAMRLEKQGMTLSVLSVCENEFGIAGENKAGSAGYDPRRLMHKLQEEKDNCDFVVVVFHGGNEFDPLPSPDTQERYRMICDMGADAVIAGHTHCPQGYEIYHGKPILYSLGNFFFLPREEKGEKDAWYYGYFTILDLDRSRLSFEVIPYRFDVAGKRITVFSGEEREKMKEYIAHLSAIIQDPYALKQYFKGWALDHPWIPQLPKNFNDLAGYNAAGHYDLLKCEAHCSQAKQALEVLFQDEVDAVKVWQEKIRALQIMPV